MDRQAGIGIETPGASLDRVFSDDAAFRRWYDRALPRVFGYLYQRCGRDRELAEELTQQAFVEAVRSRRHFRGDDEVAWLVGIARNRLSEHLRRVERRERGLFRLVARSGPEVTWTGADSGDTGDDDLADHLAQLPAAQRAALTFRYVDDLSVREVARLMGRSEGAVESLLSRGRETLRRRLGDRP